MLKPAQKFHICHLTSAHKALDTRIFNREAVSLQQAGYTVTIVGRNPKQEVVDGVKIIPLVGEKKGLILLFKITQIALKQDAAVYHFHDPDLILVGLVLKLFGKKVIYDVHEDYVQNILSRDSLGRFSRKAAAWLFRWIECFASKLFDFMIVVDSNIQQKFDPKKTEKISNVPPRRFIQATRSRPENEATFRVIFLGVISRAHGIEEMLEAMQCLKHKDGVQLNLVGDASPELYSLWAGDPHVIYLGRLPWEQSHQMLVDADAGLLLYQPTPAHWHFTGEGNTKLFEYMGSGLPVIYSNFPKLKSLIEPIGCGIAVDPTQPKEIAAAIDLLYEDADRRSILGAKGRLAVQERYNWEYEEQKLLKVYARVLSCPPRAQG